MANYMTVEAFKNYFFLKALPYWWAYESSTTPIDKVTITADEKEGMTTEDLLEYSWLQIEDLIERYPDGAKLNFRLAKNASDGKDRSLFPKLKWGNPMTVGSTSRGRQVVDHNAGNWQMMQMMMNIQEKGFQNQLNSMSGLQELQIENMILRSQVDANNQPDTQLEVIREISGVVKPVIQNWLMPKQAALGTLGQKEATSTTREKPAPTQGVSFDAVMQDCNAISEALPEYPLNHITRALAIFVQQNPNQAKVFLEPLINQLQNG